MFLEVLCLVFTYLPVSLIYPFPETRSLFQILPKFYTEQFNPLHYSPNPNIPCLFLVKAKTLSQLQIIRGELYTFSYGLQSTRTTLPGLGSFITETTMHVYNLPNHTRAHRYFQVLLLFFYMQLLFAVKNNTLMILDS